MTSGDSRGGLDRRRRYRGSSMAPQSPANGPTDPQAAGRGTRGRRNTVTHWDRQEDGSLHGTVVDLDAPYGNPGLRLRPMSATLTMAFADASTDLVLPMLPPYDENTPVAVTTASEVTPGTYFSLTLDVENLYYRYSTRSHYLNILTQSVVQLPPTQPCYQADTWIADEYVETPGYRTVIAFGERYPAGWTRDSTVHYTPPKTSNKWKDLGFLILFALALGTWGIGLVTVFAKAKEWITTWH